MSRYILIFRIFALAKNLPKHSFLPASFVIFSIFFNSFSRKLESEKDLSTFTKTKSLAVTFSKIIDNCKRCLKDQQKNAKGIR